MKKVLLTEDDAVTRFMMKDLLDELVCEVAMATNGQECHDLMQNDPHSFALILMDIHMPGLSGLDATRKIRDTLSDIRDDLTIIALTADQQYHNEAAVKRNGMDGFIRKPVSVAEIDMVISQHCPSA